MSAGGFREEIGLDPAKLLDPVFQIAHILSIPADAEVTGDAQRIPAARRSKEPAGKIGPP